MPSISDSMGRLSTPFYGNQRMMTELTKERRTPICQQSNTHRAESTKSMRTWTESWRSILHVIVRFVRFFHIQHDEYMLPTGHWWMFSFINLVFTCSITLKKRQRISRTRFINVCTTTFVVSNKIHFSFIANRKHLRCLIKEFWSSSRKTKLAVEMCIRLCWVVY